MFRLARYLAKFIRTEWRYLGRLALISVALTLGGWFGTFGLRAAVAWAAAGGLTTSCQGDYSVVLVCIGPQANAYCSHPQDAPGDPSVNAKCYWKDVNNNFPWDGTQPSCTGCGSDGVATNIPVGLAGYVCGDTWTAGCRHADGSCYYAPGGGCGTCGTCTWRSTVGCTAWDTVWAPCSGSGCTCAPPDHAPFGCDPDTRVVDSGTCSGGGSCTGTCTFSAVCSNGFLQWQVLNQGCTGTGGVTCGCTWPTSGPTSIADTTETNCGSSSPPPPGAVTPCPCTGMCNYTAVSDGLGGFIWVLSSSSCPDGVSNCSCPAGPGGQCPAQAGDTTSVACGAAGGSCTPRPCSGTCSYVAIADDANPGKFKWSLSSNTCSAGADNCTCPASPNGALCPTSLSGTTTAACGSSSGACVPGCSGQCTYTSIADPDHDGLFKWNLTDSNCSGQSSGCTCPACPTDSRPTAAGTQVTVDCGTASKACACPTPCDSRGGDADGDCCCADVDCNDYDPKVCKCNNCEGTCTRCWAPDPGKFEFKGLGNPVTWSNNGAFGGSDGGGGSKCGSLSKWVAGQQVGGGWVWSLDTGGDCTGVPIPPSSSPGENNLYANGGCYCGSSSGPPPGYIECDPNDANGPQPCTCTTGVQNGDRDGDGCCDCQDDWPDDPRQGCPCCNLSKFWYRGDGHKLWIEWKRIFPNGGVAAQFLTYSQSSKTWTYNGPTGDPASMSYSLPFNVLTQGQMSDYVVQVPLTLGQLANALTFYSGRDCSSLFNTLDSLRLLVRTALGWFFVLYCGSLCFQEFRV